MASYVGQAPWHEGYKRATKKQGYEYNQYTDPHTGRLSGGWFANQADDWKRKPSTEYRTLTGRNGKLIKVPVTDIKLNSAFADGEYWYDESAQKNVDLQEYIKTTFDPSKTLCAFDGVGHIQHGEYNVYRQVLQIIFANGDTVVYFRVPQAVYAELAYLSAKCTWDGKNWEACGGEGKFEVGARGDPRHLLGIRFWDLVRIRGTIRGGRFKYVYVSEHTPNVETYTAYNKAEYDERKMNEKATSKQKTFAEQSDNKLLKSDTSLATEQAKLNETLKTTDDIEDKIKAFADTYPSNWKSYAKMLSPNMLNKYNAAKTYKDKAAILQRAGIIDIEDLTEEL